jgi:hypothetical protein
VMGVVMPGGRPRKRDEDVEHGTDRGYRHCRAGVDGGRCDACKDAHADAEARRAAARRGLGEPPSQPVSPAVVTVLPTPVVGDEAPGPVEQAVRDEVESLSVAEHRPSDVQTAIRLARNLDNPRLATSHATLGYRLTGIMKSLREASAADRRGRLASVAALSHRTSSTARNRQA